MTAQGQPRVVFRRAIDRGNLLVAEATARELGKIDLLEALDLVCLVAEKAPERFDSYGSRWLARVVEERKLRLTEVEFVAAALRALPSPRAAAALRSIL